MASTAPLAWRTSTRCASNACVEVAEDATAFHVRDPAGAVLTFDLDAWQQFIDGIRSGMV